MNNEKGRLEEKTNKGEGRLLIQGGDYMYTHTYSMHRHTDVSLAVQCRVLQCDAMRLRLRRGTRMATQHSIMQRNAPQRIPRQLC